MAKMRGQRAGGRGSGVGGRGQWAGDRGSADGAGVVVRISRVRSLPVGSAEERLPGGVERGPEAFQTLGADAWKSSAIEV